MSSTENQGNKHQRGYMHPAGPLRAEFGPDAKRPGGCPMPHVLQSEPLGDGVSRGVLGPTSLWRVCDQGRAKKKKTYVL